MAYCEKAAPVILSCLEKNMGILLYDIFDERSIKLNVSAADKLAAFSELVDAIAQARPGTSAADMLEAVIAREDKMSTGIAPGVAVPHAFCRGSSGVVGAIGISRSGIAYDALDGKPVHAVFMVIVGDDAKGEHLHVLNRICTLANSEGFALMMEAKTPREVLDVLSRFR